MRKLLLTGDWHLRFKRPVSRTDESYFETQSGKVYKTLISAVSNNATLVQPGDFFDAPDVPYYVLQHYIRMFQVAGWVVFCVRGQHDLRYHSKKTENTALAVLEAAGVAHVLGAEPYESDNVHLYGASWGEEVPEIKDPDKFNVLVWHRMIIGDEKLWEGQEDYVIAKHLFRKFDFDLFVTGDNHQAFWYSHNGERFLFNPGSLMRSQIDQINHEPRNYLFDTVDRKWSEMALPIEPAKKVLNIKEAKKRKERDEKLEAFVKELEDPELAGLDFISNLEYLVKQSKLSKPVLDIIDEVINDE